jgi:DNA replication protein DnaC
MQQIGPTLQATLERIRRNLKNPGTRHSGSLTDKSSLAEHECPVCQDREFVLEPNPDGSWRAIPCKCREQKAVNRMLKASGLTAEQRAVRLKDFKPSTKTMAMYRQVKRYLDEFPAIYESNAVNKGMALTGTVGIGKTMLVTAIANELLERRIPTAFVVTPDLIAELRAAQFTDGGQDMEKKIHKLAATQVCIFDDVAKEKPSEWVQTQYFRIVDGRYRNRLPTIFTSNFSFDQIAERLGDAVSSRLYALTKERQVYVEAEDYRTKPGMR